MMVEVEKLSNLSAAHHQNPVKSTRFMMLRIISRAEIITAGHTHLSENKEMLLF
jgi:hypothetical protein